MDIPKHSKLYPEFRRAKHERIATRIFAIVIATIIAYTILELVKAFHA